MPDESTRTRLPRAILFDLDGTLIDTYRLYVECYRQALEPFLGHAPDEDELIARAPSSLADWLGREAAEVCHAAFRGHYARLHASLAEGMYPGVREMLAALRSAGYPLGIVTSKKRYAWEINRRDIELGVFEVVVTDDDVGEPKPSAEGLLAAAKALGVDPADAVYVGDSIVDLQAGRSAGMRTAAVLWPKTGEGEAERFLNRIREMEPDWVFERPAGLTETFAKWC